MIQSALYFAFGFLSAVLLALLIAPPIWRRAMLLTRKHVEAETPLTLNEIQAQRDGLRAEHAMAERKLELTLASTREKVAQHLALIGEKERIIRKLMAERAEWDSSDDDVEPLALEDDQNPDQPVANFAESERTPEERAAEVEQLKRRISKLSIDADSLHIELAAQSARVENLLDELKEARQDRREGDEQRRKVEADLQTARRAAEQEARQRAEFEKQAATLMTRLADAEAMLGRREKDIERLNDRLRRIVAEGRRQGASVVDAPRGKQTLVQANEASLLREEMNALAAQVVAMVAELEGPASPVNALLDKAGRHAPPIYDEKGEAIISIAERVRALQEASMAGKAAETRQGDA